MDFKSKLEYLRNLPDKQKKIILWVIVAVLAIIMGFFWVKSAINRISNLGSEIENVQFPSIEDLNQ